MPKEAKSSAEWRKKMRDYAQHKIVFGRGERPRPGSAWHTTLTKIESCPRHQMSGSKNLFGGNVRCLCLYHEVFFVCLSYCNDLVNYVLISYSTQQHIMLNKVLFSFLIAYSKYRSRRRQNLDLKCLVWGKSWLL